MDRTNKQGLGVLPGSRNGSACRQEVPTGARTLELSLGKEYI